jgi:hypothetical protein
LQAAILAALQSARTPARPLAGTAQGGTSTPVKILPPGIVCNYIIRVLRPHIDSDNDEHTSDHDTHRHDLQEIQHAALRFTASTCFGNRGGGGQVLMTVHNISQSLDHLVPSSHNGDIGEWRPDIIRKPEANICLTSG